MPTGSGCWSIASSPIAATSGLPPGCAMPDCASKPASVEDVDYRAPRGLDRALFHKLTKGEWMGGAPASQATSSYRRATSSWNQRATSSESAPRAAGAAAYQCRYAEEARIAVAAQLLGDRLHPRFREGRLLHVETP